MAWKGAMLAVTAALIGSLLGPPLASTSTPQAAACERQKPECHGGGHGVPPDDLVIQGTLTTDGGVVTVNAQSQGGQASGVATLVLGPTGPVREILPPGDGRDYYCINIIRAESGGQRANFFIRDVGDGADTFDQIAVTAGPEDQTCSDAPTTPFFTATSGDITVTH